MRAARLLRLLLILQRRQRGTASELAEELEVSVRTLYRDVASLTAAGVPLMTQSGPSGGIRLAPGWRTQLDGLTATEAGALFLAGVPKAVADLGLATVAASAQAKVDATLPPELRARAGRLRERFLLDAPGWFAVPEAIEALPICAQAVWEERRLELRYGERSVRRQVGPLGLVLKGGIWYLVASHRRRIKTYRVGRITRATLMTDAVERPVGFELSAWWERSKGEFDRALLRYPCRVRLSPLGFRRLREVVPQEAVEDVLKRTSDPDGEGWRAVRLRLESEDVAVGQLTALGAEVEVIAPRRLRRRLGAIGRTMARLNGAVG